MPTTPEGFARKIRFLLGLEEHAPRPGDTFNLFLEELAVATDGCGPRLRLLACCLIAAWCRALPVACCLAMT